jgi:hypothetical protein
MVQNELVECLVGLSDPLPVAGINPDTSSIITGLGLGTTGFFLALGITMKGPAPTSYPMNLCPPPFSSPKQFTLFCPT